MTTRLALLGNCQVDVMAKLLQASGRPDLAVTAIEIWRHKPPEFEALHDRLLAHDLIVTQELSQAYGPLATSALRARRSDLLVIQNIYFQGYHPDCVYVGPMGGRVKSPVGDYHSQAVYDAWRNGLSVAGAVQALQAYPAALARDTFDRSARELLAREAQCDVPISDRVLEPEPGHRRMFTFNHPTIELHRLYLQRIVDRLGLGIAIGICPDPLLQHTHWPVYPAVREALGLPEDRQPLVFRASASLGGALLDARTLCERSFEAYDRSGLVRA